MPREDTQFKPGHGKGRPKGARNKLSKAVLKEVLKKFNDMGSDVIDRVIEKDPSAFLRVVTSLVPKDLDVKHSGDVSVRVVNYADEPEDNDK